MARRRSAWRTRLIADGVRAPVQPRGVLAKVLRPHSFVRRRQAAQTRPTDATVDGSRVARIGEGLAAAHRRGLRTAPAGPSGPNPTRPSLLGERSEEPAECRLDLTRDRKRAIGAQVVHDARKDLRES